MRILKHALLSLKRKPTKAIMILGILFVVFAMVFTGIIINNSVEASKIAIRKDMGAVVDYTADYMKAMKDELEDYSQLELSEDVAKNIATDPSVKKLYINRTGYATSSKLKSGATNNEMQMMDGEENMIYFNLLSSSDSVPYEFQSNRYKLTDGRHLTQEEVDNNDHLAILSDTFAAKNDLTVGSTFTLTTMSETGENETEYEVIGIFSGADNNNANTIYTPLDEDNYISSVQFLLNDPLEVDEFITRNAPKLPSEYNELNAGTKQYKALTKPLNFVTTITNLFISVVFIAGAVIIIALVTIFVRDRRFEIGLLLSMGESRIKIISQFIVELVAISFVAFVLSMTVSQLSSGYVSEWIAENQFVDDEEDTSTNDFFIMGETPASHKEITMEDVAKDFDAKMSMDIVLQLMVISMSLVLIAGSIPLIIIISYNPREALQS